ncbi:hypothetical protein PRIPAC_92100 [Pristionchus pacificus]|uniref:Probable galactose-1-phosphate uridylyltransferase n=1 Tax=Pristionchus pacificus TaxID=54126 RepID=A0A2A6BQ54_PRIPA|nr:hypothetical protein PRIPAC_92100 [Pristionchus pacificus]|eukprot:PDM68030.1 hypothetical protein PRIPAC_46074 [Pristionchus pacificus]
MSGEERKSNNYRRYNPLLDEWIIVAGNRVSRPWTGASTHSSYATSFQLTTTLNPLAPGGMRSSGKTTPLYESVFVFDNDFPSFTNYDDVTETSESHDDELFQQHTIRGECRVICYHPSSEKSIALMDNKETLAVVHLWLTQFVELAPKWKWVQNRGAAVGSSNNHPHGQIWAGSFLPNLPMRKDENQRKYYEKHGRSLLLDYIEKEEKKKERVVLINDHWIVVVPFWALWPYETMVIPRRAVKRLSELTEDEQVSLADILRHLMIKYDNIFKCAFPFGMGWLGAPTGEELTQVGRDYSHWQLHLIVHPPLLRSSTVPKYMAGYEILAEPQRDITAEMAAKTIRDQSEVHYTKNE